MLDLHIHSIYSDGSGTIDDITKRAKEIGLKVIAIVDHSIEHRRGMDENKAKKRQIEIDRARDKYDIEILSGVECGILADGEIQIPDFRFDLIIVSIHDFLHTEEYYYRIRKCIEKFGDRICVMGHLHSDMFNCGRDFSKDAELIDLFVENDIAIEINSLHHAPPLDFLEMCSDRRILYSIGSDAHTLNRVGDVKWCLEVSRKFLKKGKIILDKIQ